jgi:hypothetical protein
MKMIKEVSMRLEQERIAKDVLLKGWEKYNKNGGSDSYERWKENLLVHYIIGSMERDNFKGSGI